MAKTNVQVQGISEALGNASGSLVVLSKVDAPFTSIQGRAKVTDFSKDLLPRMGTERIMFLGLASLFSEFGPAGESVFKPISDTYDQVRFVGTGWSAANDNQGQRVVTPNNSSDFMEITFYGTGLNLLCNATDCLNMSYSVDGAGAVLFFGAPTPSVIGGQYYSPNQVVKVISGLSLAMHTVKLTIAAGYFDLNGYEVLNTASGTAISATAGTSYSGGKKLYKQAASVDSHDSFESGLLGSKGGRAVVYQKDNSVVAKAFQPTDATILYYPSASHSNEEIIRTCYWREFGVGVSGGIPTGNRGFSSLGPSTPSNVNFTLSDGVTSLMAQQGFSITELNTDLLIHNLATDYIIFTFVGTGLDWTYENPVAGTRAQVVKVDNSSDITITSAVAEIKTVSIASGLPYGTHTVRFTGVGGTPNLRHYKYTIYGPKKPQVPDKAVELADYYILPAYVAPTLNTARPPSTGVISKSPSREMVYSGSWSFGNSAALAQDQQRHGSYCQGGAVSNFIEYTFYGTGFEMGLATPPSAGAVYSVKINNVLNTYPCGATSGITWTSGTSSFTMSSTSGGRIYLTGLPLGQYTVTITNTSGTAWPYFLYFDIITPIHAPKSNTPGDIQSSLSVGSCSIRDLRKISTQSAKTLSNWAQVIGVTSDPTTSSGAMVPVPDMNCTVLTNGNPIEICYSISSQNNTANNGSLFQVYVDGSPVGTSKANLTAALGGSATTAADTLIIPVSSGVHNIQLMWSITGGVSLASNIRRSLVVKEL
jgi:hypothetical protein